MFRFRLSRIAVVVVVLLLMPLLEVKLAMRL
jgi:hypothetical protein